jgi:chloramphenicol 3-O phosphotransferase
MQPGRIILLDGASSAGKSTIARARQARIDQPFWHLSIDHLRENGVLPMERILRGEFDWRAMRSAFFEGFHRALPALAGAGNDLVVEHIVETREWMVRLLELLAELDVYFVAVRCPLAELERREAARGDRPAGDARRDFETLHRFALYDLELDGTKPAAENAGALLAAWRQRARPSAFERMRRVE